MEQLQAQEFHPPYLAYSAKVLAAALSISVTSLYRDREDCNSEGIPFVQIGNRIVYPVELVKEWLLKNAKVGVYIKPTVCNEHSDIKRQRGRPKGTTKVAKAAQRNRSKYHQEPVGKEVGQ